MLAMDANDNACHLNDRVVRTFFASELAPTVLFYKSKDNFGFMPCANKSSSYSALEILEH